jgi:hypothetical protein
MFSMYRSLKKPFIELEYHSILVQLTWKNFYKNFKTSILQFIDAKTPKVSKNQGLNSSDLRDNFWRIPKIVFEKFLRLKS